MSSQAAMQQSAQSFDRAAHSYDAFAEPQVQIADTLLARLDGVSVAASARLLDLGSGTGYVAQQMRERYTDAQVCALDLSQAMLSRQARDYPASQGCCVAADAHAMPFLKGGLDGVVSSMALHWCADFQKVCAEVQSVLAPHGFFLFAMAGPDTFWEWGEAWRAVDDAQHLLSFLAPDQVAQQLSALGFVDVVLDSERWVVMYPSVSEIHHAIKATGVALPAAQQVRQGLRGRGVWRRLCEAYEAHRDAAALLPMTYEVTFGFARVPRSGVVTRGAEATVPVDQIQWR